MSDSIEILQYGSKIQHGKHNDRIYLMKIAKDDCHEIIQILKSLAKSHNYSKIFCKVPQWAAPLFIADSYVLEASIPRFYNYSEDVFFVSKFLDSNHLLNSETTKLYELSKLLFEKQKKGIIGKKEMPDLYIRRLGINDVTALTDIYKEVFRSYPFPIHNPKYIIKTMNNNIQYYGVEDENKIIAVSSAEMDHEGLNAEMTDFATKPSYQGNNLATLLLRYMEREMKKQGMRTLFTIARLNSIPMNRTFIRCYYTYSGTLIKNTNIAGEIESMNVYYKHI